MFYLKPLPSLDQNSYINTSFRVNNTLIIIVRRVRGVIGIRRVKGGRRIRRVRKINKKKRVKKNKLRIKIERNKKGNNFIKYLYNKKEKRGIKKRNK